MEYREFNKTGKKISAIGIGTWQLSGEDKNIEAIKYAIENGVNFIDTAEVYGTEPIVSEAIRDFEREDLFIASKVWPTHFRYDELIKACENSLSRLKMEYLDLYQLHWPNSAVPIEETMRAMEKLVEDGKIRYIGVSNFYLDDLKKAQSVMKKQEIVSDQVEYNIVTRDIEKDGLFDYCNKNGIAIIAYSPLSHGKIFEKSALLSDLQKIGRRYSATPAEMSLAWLLSRENVFPIPKASNVEHMKENVNSVNIKLNDKDLHFLSGLEEKYHVESIAKQHTK
mgnify:CR=1 FL=1